jgi:hypothetical protein
MRKLSLLHRLSFPDGDNRHVEYLDSDADRSHLTEESAVGIRCPLCRAPLIAVLNYHGPGWRCLCGSSAGTAWQPRDWSNPATNTTRARSECPVRYRRRSG